MALPKASAEGVAIVRRVLHLGIMLLASAGILVGIVWAVGFERTMAAVGEAGVSAFAAVGGLTLVFLLLQSLAWSVLNRPIRHRVPFHTLFEAVVVGLAGNILTPSTFLGGEPLKVVYVGRATHLPYHEVAGTVVLSKYLEAISFILFFSFSTIVAAVAYRGVLFGPYLAVGVSILAVAAFLLGLCFVLWLSLSRRWRPLTRRVGALLRVPVLSRRLAGLRERTRDMEDQVSRVFCEEGRASWQVFGAQVVGHVSIFLKPAAFFYIGEQMSLDLGQLCLLFVVGQALLAFQLTPSGAGTLDTGLIGAFALMGYTESAYIAKCMAFLLCLRFWDLILVGTGALLATHVGARILSSKADPRNGGRPDGEP